MPAATLRRIVLGSVVLALASAVTSCFSTPPAGSPKAGRPAPIDVSSRHPCDLLPAEALRTLSLRDPRKNDAAIRGTQAPSCGYFGTGAPRIDINLQFLPLPAADLRTARSGAERLRGYEIVENQQSTSRLAVCEAVADTDVSTSVRAQASAPTEELRETGSSVGALCGRAREVVDDALAVLLSR